MLVTGQLRFLMLTQAAQGSSSLLEASAHFAKILSAARF